MEATPPTCVYCGSAIDIDEPVVLVEHDGERETSLAREPALARRVHVVIVHSRCAPAGWRDAAA
jgi:hypothetical protein